MKIEQIKVGYLFWSGLVLCLLFSFILRFDFEFNGGQIDEYDYLFVARQLFSGETWNTYSYIFGFDLNWYLLGLGELMGGLIGARMIAGVLGIISLFGLYQLTFLIWNSKPIAFLATGLLALQASHLFLSKFATYDIIALAYFSLALPAILKASTRQVNKRFFWIIVSVLLFSLAVLSKYVVVVYFPILALALFWYSPRYALIFTLFITSMLAFYLWLYWEELQVLYTVQVLGTHMPNSSYGEIFYRMLSYLGIPLTLWFLAIIYSIWNKGDKIGENSTTAIFVVLLILALPLVLYHFNGRNIISLYKHIVYATYFLSPVMAWLVWNLLVYFRFHLVMQLSMLTIVFGITMYNHKLFEEMENGYPDMSIVEKVFENITIDNNTTVASENPYLLRYILFDRMPQTHIKELYWLDNNQDGKYTFQDSLDAIWDRKFMYVVLCDLLHPQKNKKIREILKIRGYQEKLEIPWKTSQVMSHRDYGSIRLYERTLEPTILIEEDKLFQ